jgi:hypothetical protein
MVSKQWEKLGVFSIEEREQYRKNNSGLWWTDKTWSSFIRFKKM